MQATFQECQAGKTLVDFCKCWSHVCLSTPEDAWVQQTGCENEFPPHLLLTILGYLETTVLQPRLATPETLAVFGATCVDDCMTYIVVQVDQVMKEDPQRANMLADFVQCAGKLPCTTAPRLHIRQSTQKLSLLHWLLIYNPCLSNMQPCCCTPLGGVRGSFMDAYIVSPHAVLFPFFCVCTA